MCQSTHYIELYVKNLASMGKMQSSTRYAKVWERTGSLVHISFSFHFRYLYVVAPSDLMYVLKGGVMLKTYEDNANKEIHVHTAK